MSCLMFRCASTELAVHLRGKEIAEGVFKPLCMCACMNGWVCMFHHQLQHCKNSEHKY